MAEKLVDCILSERGELCVAAVQEIFSRFDLNATDGMMAAGQLFAWAHILAMLPVGKERCLAQIERSAISAREWAGSNFDSFKARAEVIAELDSGQSGGRLQ